MRFRELSSLAQKSVTQYMEEGDPDRNWRDHFDFRETSIHLDFLKFMIMSTSDFFGQAFEDFETYHEWYMLDCFPPGDSRGATGSNEVWPVIAQTGELLIDLGPISDGWHRFHQYIDKGLTMIPIVYILDP